ncbi:homoprotocatechuate degradation operon regulator, HpaR [Brevibacterium casei]|uniref:Homoprotocatechuate degradation operon regulator, HpaR n=1 Tax=Brevibacterium casei TaxID=33889 RepID=A0A449DBY0_9MICO|nr:homoprotocatechuate degradation operon regulator, HpaR [Brevibacterium casei]
MGIRDDAVEIRARGWRTLAALHGLIDTGARAQPAARAGLSVVEFTVLDALSRQDGWHMRMRQLARAAALSSSATTRLVTRLEDRGLLTRILCADDRRGIYTELTQAGEKLLAAASRRMIESSRGARRGPRPPGSGDRRFGVERGDEGFELRGLRASGAPLRGLDHASAWLRRAASHLLE